MLDATVCDIYLVNDTGSLVGRPILTACVDAYSGLCCGYSLSWEGCAYSLRGLMLNIIADKVSWCQKFGISIHRTVICFRLHSSPTFTVIESRYQGKDLTEVQELQTSQRDIARGEVKYNLQAQINLAHHNKAGDKP